MCMYDDGEGYTVSQRAERKARKPHRCDECGRTILPGERYEALTGLYEGSWCYTKVCLHCLAARRWLSKVCGGWMDEAVEMDLQEHVTGEEQYIRSSALVRLYRWMLADWRDREGNLRPIADVEAVADRAIELWNDQYNKAVAA